MQFGNKNSASMYLNRLVKTVCVLFLTMPMVLGCTGTKKAMNYEEYEGDFEKVISATNDVLSSVGLEVLNGEYLDDYSYQITAAEIVDRLGNEPVQSLLINVDLNKLESGKVGIQIDTPNKNRYVMGSSGAFESSNYRERIFSRLNKQFKNIEASNS